MGGEPKHGWSQNHCKGKEKERKVRKKKEKRVENAP